MKAERKYLIIDSIILIISFVLFVFNYYSFFSSAMSGVFIVAEIFIVAVIVNGIKAFRMFLIIYGNEINGSELLGLYSRTAIVSSILPYKSGELYRMFCFGRRLKDIQKGIIITLLDRFMDTMGILIVMLLSAFIYPKDFTLNLTAIILILFIVCAFICYYSFRGISIFWKKYLLKNKATRHRIWGLEVISRLQSIYNDISQIIKGRGMLLIASSVLAWLVEVGSVGIINRTAGSTQASVNISEYLNSILTGRAEISSIRYTIMSVILMAIIYIGYCIGLKLHSGEKDEKLNSL